MWKNMSKTLSRGRVQWPEEREKLFELDFFLKGEREFIFNSCKIVLIEMNMFFLLENIKIEKKMVFNSYPLRSSYAFQPHFLYLLFFLFFFFFLTKDFLSGEIIIQRYIQTTCPRTKWFQLRFDANIIWFLFHKEGKNIQKH